MRRLGPESRQAFVLMHPGSQGMPAEEGTQRDSVAPQHHQRGMPWVVSGQLQRRGVEAPLRNCPLFRVALTQMQRQTSSLEGLRVT